MTPIELVKWHRKRATQAMGNLHCGSENWEYRAAGRLHDWHMDAANMLSGMLGACNLIGFESSTKEAGNDA